MSLTLPRPGWSLATKVLLGLLLNLVLVGATFTAVLVVQVQLNPGWLLAGRAGERLRSIADMMAGDLHRSGPGEEATVVVRYREAYQMEFMLFDLQGRDIAAGTNTVPLQVAQALTRPRNESGVRNPGQGRRGGMRLRRAEGDADAPDGSPRADAGGRPEPEAGGAVSEEATHGGPDGVPKGPPERDARPRFGRGAQQNRPEPGNESPIGTGPGSGPGPGFRTRTEVLRQGQRPGPVPHTVLHAGAPPAYWILLPLPPRELGAPLTLVVRAQSLWSGGFLLDPQPWILAGTGALVLSILFWLPIVRGITRDLGRMTHRTEEIAAGRFDHRLGLTRRDELGRLAEAIDRMASRLSHHVDGQKRFLGDAAHELSSPLARMQTLLAILETRPPSEQGSYLDDLHEELDEMAGLVNELLAFSRALHGRPPRLENAELRPLVDRAWAREGGPEVSLVNRVPEKLTVSADAQLLQRAIANLLRNAIRYAGHAGPITVDAARDGSQVVITVADVGPGVAPEALPRLFEPFFRPEDSRARELGGTGLGLAIVRTCVDACRGTVSAANRSPAGFEVVIRIPAVR
jgi:two-component system sensor histidine kinase CpxA